MFNILNMWMAGFETMSAMAIFGLILLIIWSAILKGIGLWKSGRNNQIGWFIVMFLFNTAGIFPIIYLIWFQKKRRG